MPASETIARATPYLRELLDDDYAQERLRRGGSQLRAAYDRSRKRRVTAAHDRKLRGQVADGSLALVAAAKALSGRTEKPRHRGRKLALLLTLLLAGTGAALALSGDLRNSLFGGSSAPEDGVSASDGAPS
jgi:hypothetical protein